MLYSTQGSFIPRSNNNPPASLRPDQKRQSACNSSPSWLQISDFAALWPSIRVAFAQSLYPHGRSKRFLSLSKRTLIINWLKGPFQQHLVVKPLYRQGKSPLTTAGTLHLVSLLSQYFKSIIKAAHLPTCQRRRSTWLRPFRGASCYFGHLIEFFQQLLKPMPLIHVKCGYQEAVPLPLFQYNQILFIFQQHLHGYCQ